MANNQQGGGYGMQPRMGGTGSMNPYSPTPSGAEMGWMNGQMVPKPADYNPNRMTQEARMSDSWIPQSDPRFGLVSSIYPMLSQLRGSFGGSLSNQTPGLNQYPYQPNITNMQQQANTFGATRNAVLNGPDGAGAPDITQLIRQSNALQGTRNAINTGPGNGMYGPRSK